MSLPGAFAAELRKLSTLPAGQIAVAGTVLGSVGITLLNAVSTRAGLEAGSAGPTTFTSAFEVGYAAVPLGTVGAVVVGVIAMSSEYAANSSDAGAGRQITASLAAVPRRGHVLTAKALAVALLVAATAVVTVPVSAGVAALVIGDAGDALPLGVALARMLGAALYWILTGLIALAVTVLARSGLVPLVVLVANSSLVSVSLLLTTVTPLAHWLPDLAGRRLLGGLSTVEGGLDAGPGALVMAAWAFGLLAVAGVVLSRRDA
ncbi:ABC transporter permease [Promicromonospora sp. MS192]|uniref:ABC transporter permease n=1 Tax=Promicromonospora sp. MS192 TaxID=3412684 RepID=UPI003C2C6F2C